MAKETFYYARVSSTEQNLSRQLEEFKKMGADDRHIIVDKQSGKDTNRQGYLALRNSLLRDGDTLVVKSLDRLSRNKADISKELQYFKENGIRVKILDLPTTTVDFPEGQEWIAEMINNIIIEVMGTIAEQERLTIRKRQAEGIDVMPIGADGKKHSLKTGKAIGRPTITYPDNWDDVYKRWTRKEITSTSAMKELNLKKTSFYKLVKTYTRENE